MTSFAPGGLKSAAPIDIAIVYYARNRAGRSLIATTNHLWDPAIWHQIEGFSRTAYLGSDPVPLNEAVIASGSEQRLIWSTYWMDGRFTTSSTAIKLLQLKTAFVGDETAALIAFSVPIEGAVADAQKHLERALRELTLHPDRLVAARQTGARR
jgi:EpsI family protein